MANKLHDLVADMKDDGVFEDRREYSAEDLAEYYSLTEQETDDLYWLIHSEFEPGPSAKLQDLTGNQIIGFIEDAEHGNFDGWDSEHDRIVIRRFIEDMRRGAVCYPKEKEV